MTSSSPLRFFFLHSMICSSSSPWPLGPESRDVLQAALLESSAMFSLVRCCSKSDLMGILFQPQSLQAPVRYTSVQPVQRSARACHSFLYRDKTVLGACGLCVANVYWDCGKLHTCQQVARFLWGKMTTVFIEPLSHSQFQTEGKQ